MKNISNIFSWAFIIGAIFLCHGVVADDISGQFSSPVLGYTFSYIDEMAKKSDVVDSTNVSKIYTKTLCKKDYYVSRCGNYHVGFEWLKSVTLNDTDTSNTSNEHTTQNYYSNTFNLFDQMRKFFRGAQMEAIDANNKIIPVPSSTIFKDRGVILNNVCNPLLREIECTPCPSGGSVPASTVSYGSDDKIIINSWKFYTFADCVVKDFKDTTGNYHYHDPASNNSDSKAECYYANTKNQANFNGDNLTGFEPY